MTGDELQALYRHFIRDLENTRMNLQQLRVAKLIALLSFGCGQATARITKHADIGDAVWIHRKDVGEVIEELKTMQILREPQTLVFALETDRAKWKPQWRWNREADRAKGIATLRALIRFQRIEQAELLAPEPCFDAALLEITREDALRETANPGNALLPEVPSPAGAGTALGLGHRENATSLPMSRPKAETEVSKRDEALAMRAQIAQSLRAAGWTDEELRSLEDVPADRLHGWVSHPPTRGDSPTELVGDSPTGPRAGARVQTNGTIGSNATGTQSIHSIQCGEASPARKWRDTEDLMRRVRRAVGEDNAGYWWKVLENAGAMGQTALHEALCEWELRRGPAPDKPSNYLFGIYRRYWKAAQRRAPSGQNETPPSKESPTPTPQRRGLTDFHPDSTHGQKTNFP